MVPPGEIANVPKNLDEGLFIWSAKKLLIWV